VPVVAVAAVDREDLAQSLNLSGEFRPYLQVGLHAKIAGYLQSISVDVGDEVKEGQTIAQLDVPEMLEELQKAKATLGENEHDVTRAEAAHTDAKLAFDRLQEVVKEHPKLVAQQEVDTSQMREATSASALAAARQKVEEGKAEVARISALRGYMSIVAPFDGIVTKRSADPGALVQAGTSGTTQPVVNIVHDQVLRLTFPVPESNIEQVKVGAMVHVTVNASGEKFDAKISRVTGNVDRATRTMLVECDVDNPNHRFRPGMIADVKLVTREAKNAVAVPVEAITMGEKPTVMVVGADKKIARRAVQLGLTAPDKAEVLAGLTPGDQVVVGSRSGIQPGQLVSPRLIAATPVE
jgi:RND family efflux transporter MFP subunit